MPDVVLNFDREEYAARLARVRRSMAARELEVLVVSDPSNMAWLTGYDGWSFYTHQCVVVGPDDEPLWFGRGIDLPGAMRTVWMAEDAIHDYPDDYVQSTERHPMERLAALIAARGWQQAAIGVEMDNYYFSPAALFALQRGLGDATWHDATGLVNWCRAVKSAREIEYMRRAARIVEAIHARIFERIEPGMRKCDLAAEIFDAGIRGADGHGGDYPAIVPLLPSGADAGAPHLTWDDRPLRAGEATFFEVAGCHRRYHCPLSRTIYLGRPSQTFIDAEKAVLEGMQAGLEEARPGRTCEEVAVAFFTALGRHGIVKDNRTGYSIGLSYPPDWGERTMSLRRGDHTVLEAGMTFHFMTGLWMADWGFETTESILITDVGAECLADVPRRLLVKE